MNDFVDASGRHRDVLGQAVLAEFQGNKKLLLENLAWMDVPRAINRQL